jgi:hypothetical protein
VPVETRSTLPPDSFFKTQQQFRPSQPFVPNLTLECGSRGLSIIHPEPIPNLELLSDLVIPVFALS